MRDGRRRIARLVQRQAEIETDFGIFGSQTVSLLESEGRSGEVLPLEVDDAQVIISFRGGGQVQSQKVFVLRLVGVPLLCEFRGALKVQLGGRFVGRDSGGRNQNGREHHTGKQPPTDDPTHFAFWCSFIHQGLL